MTAADLARAAAAVWRSLGRAARLRLTAAAVLFCAAAYGCGWALHRHFPLGAVLFVAGAAVVLAEAATTVRKGVFAGQGGAA